MITQTSDNSYVEEFVADTIADMADIAEKYNLDTCAPGSTCLVIENSSVYMMNSSGEWTEL